MFYIFCLWVFCLHFFCSTYGFADAVFIIIVLKIFFSIFWYFDPHKIKKFREILMELRRRHHKLWWIINWLLLPFNCCCCCHYNFILNLRFVLLILTTLLKFSFFFSYSWWTDVGWCWCCCWQIIIKYLYKNFLDNSEKIASALWEYVISTVNILCMDINKETTRKYLVLKQGGGVAVCLVSVFYS